MFLCEKPFSFQDMWHPNGGNKILNVVCLFRVVYPSTRCKQSPLYCCWDVSLTVDRFFLHPPHAMNTEPTCLKILSLPFYHHHNDHHLLASACNQACKRNKHFQSQCNYDDDDDDGGGCSVHTCWWQLDIDCLARSNRLAFWCDINTPIPSIAFGSR